MPNQPSTDVNHVAPRADESDVAASTDSPARALAIHATDLDGSTRPRPASGPAAAPSATPLLELVTSTTELTFLVDAGFRVVYAGGPIGSLLGHDASEVVGSEVADLVHPTHRAPFRTAMEHVLRGATLADAALRWPHADGGTGLDLRVSFAHLPAAPGATAQPVVDGFMIRAAHQPSYDAAIAGLEGRDDDLRSVAQTLPIATFLLDGRGRCVFMSSPWTQMTGVTEQASLGLGWIGALIDDDRQSFRVAAAQAHARRTGWRQQFRVRRQNGDLLWVDAAAAPRLAADGSVAGYVGFLADATIEVHARAELNRRTTIVESTAEFVVMDERGPRLMYGDAATVPLASTPPVPAADVADVTRPSLGGLESDAQSRYLNEIRPAVLADGVWQDQATPAGLQLGAARDVASPEAPEAPAHAPIQPPVQAVVQAVVQAPVEEIVEETADLPQPPIPQPTPQVGTVVVAQPMAWDFDADPSVADVAATASWSSPSADRAEPAEPPAVPPVDHAANDHAANDHAANDHAPNGQAAIEATRGAEQVFVGLVGPSGRVETVAAVTDSILEPVPWESVGDQLPTIDPITGLANRALFLERIRHALNRMTKDGVSVALMLPTLHGYSELRQRVGRKTGDDQLFVMAKRLEATIRQTDTAARIGEEDFGILALGWFFPGDVENVAMRFVRKLSEPVPSVGEQVVVPCSMGVAVSEAGLDLHQLLRRAQRARKMAAELGPSRVYIYRAD